VVLFFGVTSLVPVIPVSKGSKFIGLIPLGYTYLQSYQQGIKSSYFWSAAPYFTVHVILSIFIGLVIIPYIGSFFRRKAKDIKEENGNRSL
jgi:hypothetical protein